MHNIIIENRLQIPGIGVALPAADRAGGRHSPHEFMCKVLRGYRIDPKNSRRSPGCSTSELRWH
jgi:hypothetical protein